MFVMSLKAQNINVGAVVSIWTEKIQNEILRWIWLLIYLKMPNLQVYVCMFAIIYNLYGFFSRAFALLSDFMRYLFTFISMLQPNK